jgi:hypothetical protein
MEAKYKVNEEVFVVNEYRIVKVRIDSIVVTETVQGKSLEYTVSALKEGKNRQMNFKEAYLVKTLDEAKTSALKNWENIYESVKKGINSLTLESYQKAEDEAK